MLLIGAGLVLYIVTLIDASPSPPHPALKHSQAKWSQGLAPDPAAIA